MAGISAIQGATTINPTGTATFSAPQVGLVTGPTVILTLVGASHAAYLWTLAGPHGTGSTLSDYTSLAPTFRPDRADVWTVVLLGLASDGHTEATYMLPLYIVQVSHATATGPLQLPYAVPAQIPLPPIGYHIFQDRTNAAAISTKDVSGNVAVLGGIPSLAPSFSIEITPTGPVVPFPAIPPGYYVDAITLVVDEAFDGPARLNLVDGMFDIFDAPLDNMDQFTSRQFLTEVNLFFTPGATAIGHATLFYQVTRPTVVV